MNPPANAGDAVWISGLGRFPGIGNGYHSSILAWRIPWAEESGGLQSLQWQKFKYNLATKQQRAYLGDGLRKK